MLNSQVPVIASDNDTQTIEKAKATAHKWGFDYNDESSASLVLKQSLHELVLCQQDEPKLGAIKVDLASDALTYRRQHGGGKKEAIARAVGLKGSDGLRVIDATAGLGRDALILANLGCKVDMIERSPVVAALLDDGLQRAKRDISWIESRMHLHHGVSVDLLTSWPGTPPEVVYLDPMFPHKKKTALVKKEMRLFQQLLGPDKDADKLLPPALKLATRRVVVKRPNTAPFLNGAKPNMAIESKKHRFDVYLTDLA